MNGIETLSVFRIKRKKRLGSKVKVRRFSGARIKDFLQLINNSTTGGVAGTNDSLEQYSDEIRTELLSLKKMDSR